jgi:hypothetical protein
MILSVPTSHSTSVLIISKSFTICLVGIVLLNLFSFYVPVTFLLLKFKIKVYSLQ